MNSKWGWRSMGGVAFVVVLNACGGPPGDGDGSGGMGGDVSNAGGSSASGGSGNASGGSDTTENQLPLSLLSACRDYSVALCERRNECLGFEYRDCSIAAPSTCPDALFSEGSTRTAKSVTACAKQVASDDCEGRKVGATPSCATPGTRAVGEACSFPSQCETLECSTYGDACGVCLPLVGLNESCTDGMNACSSENTCTGGTCQPTAVPPEPDPDPPVIEPPSQPGEYCGTCTEGYICGRVTTAELNPTCLAAPALGADCLVSPYFDEAHLCASSDFCGTDGKCATLPGLGATCGTPLDGGFRACGAGTDCAADLTCTKVPGPGLPCLVLSDNFGQVCSGSSCVEGTCKTERSLGKDCSSPSVVCEPHTLCTNGICVADDTLSVFDQLCGGI